MIVNSTHKNMLISPARNIIGEVELYEGSTLLNTFLPDMDLSSFTVNRAGEKKFFGFGISHEIEMELVDKERIIEIAENQALKVKFSTDTGVTVSPTPYFYVSDIKRNENTNGLTVKGYDAIYRAKNHTISELNLQAPYTMIGVVEAIAEALGVGISMIFTLAEINLEYPTGANFDGSETFREVLDAFAEATQTVYYMGRTNRLTFKQLGVRQDEPVLTIRKADYFTLQNEGSRTLANICNATELGDNITTTTGIEGETQYVRDNPFWELRSDIDILIDDAINLIGGLTAHQFDCKWRGNYLLEPGDKIAIVTKDDSTITSFLINDKYTYNGGLVAESSWSYEDNEDETAENPNTLGGALKQTFAKVDKANKEIQLVASDVQANKEQISSLILTTDGIAASVSKIDGNMSELSKEVSTKVSAEDVNISIKKVVDDGIERVTTSTGFTFNEEGLHISKADSEVTTSITEDGMKVFRSNDEVLVADSLGVKAEDLHATTFLIIGSNSRLENYNSNRTGCFWIGG